VGDGFGCRWRATALTFLAICRAEELTGMFATVNGRSAMV